MTRESKVLQLHGGFLSHGRWDIRKSEVHSHTNLLPNHWLQVLGDSKNEIHGPQRARSFGVGRDESGSQDAVPRSC